jgi:hypothetical protein
MDHQNYIYVESSFLEHFEPVTICLKTYHNFRLFIRVLKLKDIKYQFVTINSRDSYKMSQLISNECQTHKETKVNYIFYTVLCVIYSISSPSVRARSHLSNYSATPKIPVRNGNCGCLMSPAINGVPPQS